VPLATQFQQKLGQEFVITVEVAPPRGLSYAEVIERSRKFTELGVDAINVSENTGSRVRMSCTALAHLIQSHTGMETILHFTCRERDLGSIQSELLGAAALGIRNILALTGEPSTAGELPHVTSVFDVNATGLVRILHGFNHGYTITGHDIGQPTGFRIGVTVNLAAEDLETEVAQFEERMEGGAHFAQTQPLYDLAIFERFRQRVGAFPVPVLVSVLPLTSGRHAEFLHHEVPGIIIPEAIRQRMHEAPDPKQEGLKIAKEFIRQLRDQVAGVHLMVQADHATVVSEIMSACAASASC
jgi:homocysteine S-methyltransferase